MMVRRVLITCEVWPEAVDLTNEKISQTPKPPHQFSTWFPSYQRVAGGRALNPKPFLGFQGR